MRISILILSALLVMSPAASHASSAKAEKYAGLMVDYFDQLERCRQESGFEREWLAPTGPCGGLHERVKKVMPHRKTMAQGGFYCFPDTFEAYAFNLTRTNTPADRLAKLLEHDASAFEDCRKKLGG